MIFRAFIELYDECESLEVIPIYPYQAAHKLIIMHTNKYAVIYVSRNANVCSCACVFTRRGVLLVYGGTSRVVP